ncbi:hypothetical protein OQA88_10463 [Cercophora sp. LCS_1]
MASSIGNLSADAGTHPSETNRPWRLPLLSGSTAQKGTQQGKIIGALEDFADPTNTSVATGEDPATTITAITSLDVTPASTLHPFAQLSGTSTRHKRSDSSDSDSALGSSVASNDGDGTEEAPLLPHATILSQAEPRRTVPHTELPIPSHHITTSEATGRGARSDLGCAALVVQGTRNGETTETTPHANHFSTRLPDSSILHTDVQSPNNILGGEGEVEVHAVSAEVATTALRSLGISLDSQGPSDKVIDITASYLRELAKAAKEPRDNEAPHSLVAEGTGSNPGADQWTPVYERSCQQGDGKRRRYNPIRRRRRSPQRRKNDGDEDSDGQNRKDQDQTGPASKVKNTIEMVYSCPFRKQSPEVFNVRTHVKCANQAFVGMSNLKKHVASEHYHGRIPCGRCGQDFESAEDLGRHLQSPEACPLRISPSVMTCLEDGITKRTKDLLSRRDGQRVDSWHRLWFVVFGEGKAKDSGFLPVVELEEILVEFDTRIPYFDAQLGGELAIILADQLNDSSMPRVIQCIKRIVEHWLRGFLERCREIPTRRRGLREPTPVSRPIEAVQDNTVAANSALLGLTNIGSHDFMLQNHPVVDHREPTTSWGTDGVLADDLPMDVALAQLGLFHGQDVFEHGVPDMQAHFSLGGSDNHGNMQSHQQ